MKLKPKEGQIFIKLNGDRVASEGEELPNETYYQRAIQNGDLVVVSANKEIKPNKLKE